MTCLFVCSLFRAEVSRVGVQLELQLSAYTTARATQDLSPSTTDPTAQGNAWSQTHWARPGIEPTSSWILVGFFSHWATTRTPQVINLKFKKLEVQRVKDLALLLLWLRFHLWLGHLYMVQALPAKTTEYNKMKALEWGSIWESKKFNITVYEDMYISKIIFEEISCLPDGSHCREHKIAKEYWFI